MYPNTGSQTTSELATDRFPKTFEKKSKFRRDNNSVSGLSSKSQFPVVVAYRGLFNIFTVNRFSFGSKRKRRARVTNDK